MKTFGPKLFKLMVVLGVLLFWRFGWQTIGSYASEGPVADTVYQASEQDNQSSALTVSGNIWAKDTKRGGQVFLRWERSEFANLLGYKIYRKPAEGEFELISEQVVTEEHYLDTGLVNNEKYSYQILAVDDAGNSNSVGVIEAVPTLDITPPPVPKDLSAEDEGTGKKILLKWSAVEAGDLVGYNLYRQEREDWVQVNQEPVMSTTFIDTRITNGTIYHYQVKSIDDVNNESASSPAVRAWGTNKQARIIWQFGATGSVGADAEHLYAPYGVNAGADSSFFVADSQNGRVIEVNAAGEVLWQFSGLVEPTRAKDLGDGRVLIVDSGGSQIIIVDQDQQVPVWSYGKGGKRHGKQSGELNNPHDAVLLNNGHVLIADTGNGRLLEVNAQGNVVWDSSGKGSGFSLNLPVSISIVGTGNFLVTDAGLNKVLELTKQGQLVWSYGSGIPGKGERQLDYPVESLRAANGNTFIVDSMNYRILEIAQDGTLIWQWGGRATQGAEDPAAGLYEPGGIAHLADNHLLVADQHNHRIVRIDH